MAGGGHHHVVRLPAQVPEAGHNVTMQARLNESPTPDLTVVIPTYNRRDSVLELVQALRAQADGGVEIVVVVDGSNDGTLEALRLVQAQDSALVLVEQGNTGKRLATAAAVEVARGRVLLFLDDDILPAPGLIAGHRAGHRESDDLVLVGYMPTRVPEPTLGRHFATLMYAQEYEGRCASYERDASDVLQHLWMGNVSLVRSTYLRALCDLPHSFPYRHEDRDVGLVLAEQGLRGAFRRELLAWHQHSRSPRQFIRDCFQQGAGAAALSLRYESVPVVNLDSFARDLPPPLAILVKASRSRPLSHVVTSALRMALELATRLRDPRYAVVLARVVRRVQLQRGALSVLDGG